MTAREKIRGPTRRLRAALLRHLPAEARLEPGLRAALAQCVLSPGKMIRGNLVLSAARPLGVNRNICTSLAVAVEYFHTASLLLDDLPCMDNAELRRGEPCVHRRHGEATAILAALALINRAYALAHAAVADQHPGVRRRVTHWLDCTLGVQGLVGGQAWDLAFVGANREGALACRVAARKTGALLLLAAMLPAELARPARAERKALRAWCVYWGQLFQLADDRRDLTGASAAEGKTTARDRLLGRPNIALALGAGTEARQRRLLGQAAQALARLRVRRPARWSHLVEAHRALTRTLAPAWVAEQRAA